MLGNELVLARGDVAESEETVVAWAQGLGLNAETELPEVHFNSAAMEMRVRRLRKN